MLHFLTEAAEVLVSYPSVDELAAMVGQESLSGLEQGHIQVVTINRPEARNALTHSAYAGLEKAIRESSARCIIVTGTDPAFCSVPSIPTGRNSAFGSRRPWPHCSLQKITAKACSRFWKNGLQRFTENKDC